MAFDPDLADRLEAELRQQGADPVRKRMFGGIAFLVGGHMSCGLVQGEMHVRVGAEAYAENLAKPGAREMDVTGRVMTGWVTLDGPEDLDEDALSGWVSTSLGFVRTLPPKP